MAEFMEQGITMTLEVHYETLKKLHTVIQTKRRGVLLHDIARLHTAVRAQALLEHFNWELSDHLPPTLISLRATTICLPTCKTGWDHSASTATRS
jgi:hypothetical protein